ATHPTLARVPSTTLFRSGAPLQPPTLADAGYQLVGGRLLPGAIGSVAQFMYEDASHQRLTLYVQPRSSNAQEAAFRYTREEGIRSEEHTSELQSRENLVC